MIVIKCNSEEEWDYIFKFVKDDKDIQKYWKLKNKPFLCLQIEEKRNTALYFGDVDPGWVEDLQNNRLNKIFSFEEYLKYKKIKIKGMKKQMWDVLEKTYNNQILRQSTVPLFMSSPGLGKSSVVKEFAESIGVTMLKTTLSQRMPNEVVGGLMPNLEKKVWQTLDCEHLYNLKDGDIWFIDEVFNGTMKQTLDALLNFLEDRMLPSGKPLANVMIIGASNPQGLINITPQIKERFSRYDLKFDKTEYQNLLTEMFYMPFEISTHLCSLISKEQFEAVDWNYKTPRSIVKAINQISYEVQSPLDDTLLPFLKLKMVLPKPFNGKLAGEEIEYLEFLKSFTKFKDSLNNPEEAPKINKQNKNDTTNKINEN